MGYGPDISLIDTEVDGVKPWCWSKHAQLNFDIIEKDWNDSHKEKFLKYTEGRRTVCVQAGGFMGMYPRLLSEHFERVYTFEPDPFNFFCLSFNCQKNNIIKMQTALGKEHKLISVNRLFADNPGMNNINEEHHLIPMITIDSLNLDIVDFMQIDVELYELNVIHGAIETIKKFKPVLSFELGSKQVIDKMNVPGFHHNGHTKYDTHEQDILDILSPLGYKKIDMSCTDGIFICEGD